MRLKKETCEREYRFGTRDILSGIRMMGVLGWKPIGRRVVTMVEYEREVEEPGNIGQLPTDPPPASQSDEDILKNRVGVDLTLGQDSLVIPASPAKTEQRQFGVLPGEPDEIVVSYEPATPEEQEPNKRDKLFHPRGDEFGDPWGDSPPATPAETEHENVIKDDGSTDDLVFDDGESDEPAPPADGGTRGTWNPEIDDPTG